MRFRMFIFRKLTSLCLPLQHEIEQQNIRLTADRKDLTDQLERKDEELTRLTGKLIDIAFSADY